MNNDNNNNNNNNYYYYYYYYYYYNPTSHGTANDDAARGIAATHRAPLQPRA
jgi:hypothetical protein